MKFKQLLLLITTVTNLGMILSNNKIINSNQNTTFLNKNNVSKISFNKMTGTTGEINSLTLRGNKLMPLIVKVLFIKVTMVNLLKK
ncbi:hypothetical protein [Spiroplasma endosymbiont of Cleonymus obscurus]|uniref:hypothetical protein n=1 Tax=Spiroplasma endosymbiont of Cleonymus obscurus TaxID=3066324 RepID=UPI0037DD9628